MAWTSLDSALKASMEAASREPAAEWCHEQVGVNLVSTGNTRTQLGSWIAENNTARKNRLKNVPLRRVGEPADIADVAVFLSSPAASYITARSSA
jgi:NAD(P)-dependent dehydrogenase (short-subunit alcohol dehydrogenase family)